VPDIITLQTSCTPSTLKTLRQALPTGDWFCHGECAQVYSALDPARSKGGLQPLPSGLRLPAGCKHPAGEYTWQWLRGADGTAATKKALEAALELLDNCFDPIVDDDGACRG
jgi:hypothetical protein